MVPEGWEATQVGDLGKFTSGGTPSKKNDSFWGGDYPWISGKDLKTHYLETSIETLSKEGFDNAKIAPMGASLVLVRGMTLLKDFPVGYATRDMAFNQDIKAIIAKNSVDDLFLSYLLYANKQKIRQLVSTAGHGTGRIDSESLKSYPVNLPPEIEQKKIAKILSTWDKTIATVEKLITNSQQQKKALMQQLLTGKKRLPGFDGEWEDKYLTEIAEVIVSPVDKKTVDGEVPVELCNYTDVYYNSYITRDIDFMRATAKTSEITKYTLQVGDVIITKDSETPGDIAVPAVVAEELDGVLCGYHLAIIRPKNEVADGGYLNFLFSMPKTRYYFFTLATGATRFGLSVGGINKAHFTLPPYDEQKAITRVLRSADKEVALLKSQLEKFKGEKTALMQQLLTGKRRVA